MATVAAAAPRESLPGKGMQPRPVPLPAATPVSRVAAPMPYLVTTPGGPCPSYSMTASQICQPVATAAQDRSWMNVVLLVLWPRVCRYIGEMLRTQMEKMTHKMSVEVPDFRDDITRFVERLEKDPWQLPLSTSWINRIFADVWSLLRPLLEESIQKVAIPKIKAKLPSPLRDMEVHPCTIGDRQPEIKSITTETRKFRTAAGYKENMHFIFDIEWNAIFDVGVNIKGFKLGLEAVIIKSTLHMCLVELTKKPPFIGGVNMWMVNPPDFQMDWNGALEFMNNDMMSELIHSQVNKAIGKIIVLPTRMAFAIDKKNFDIFTAKRPPVFGLLKLNVLSASGLRGDDIGLNTLWSGKKTSDPYVFTELGATQWKTKTIQNSTGEAEWENEVKYIFLDEPLDQSFNITVFDEDKMSGDDPLAKRRKVKLAELLGVDRLDSEALRKEMTNRPRLKLEVVWPDNTILVKGKHAHDEAMDRRDGSHHEGGLATKLLHKVQKYAHNIEDRVSDLVGDPTEEEKAKLETYLQLEATWKPLELNAAIAREIAGGVNPDEPVTVVLFVGVYGCGLVSEYNLEQRVKYFARVECLPHITDHGEEIHEHKQHEDDHDKKAPPTWQETKRRPIKMPARATLDEAQEKLEEKVCMLVQAGAPVDVIADVLDIQPKQVLKFLQDGSVDSHHGAVEVRFEEGFLFMLADPKPAKVKIELFKELAKDESELLGYFSYSVETLLGRPNLTDRPTSRPLIGGSCPQATISAKLQMFTVCQESNRHIRHAHGGTGRRRQPAPVLQKPGMPYRHIVEYVDKLGNVKRMVDGLWVEGDGEDPEHGAHAGHGDHTVKERLHEAEEAVEHAVHKAEEAVEHAVHKAEEVVEHAVHEAEEVVEHAVHEVADVAVHAVEGAAHKVQDAAVAAEHAMEGAVGHLRHGFSSFFHRGSHAQPEPGVPGEQDLLEPTPLIMSDSLEEHPYFAGTAPLPDLEVPEAAPRASGSPHFLEPAPMVMSDAPDEPLYRADHPDPAPDEDVVSPASEPTRASDQYLGYNFDGGDDMAPMIGVCWPGPRCGGGTGPYSRGLTYATDVYATFGAFLALDNNTGYGGCWGLAEYGGNCPDVNLWGTTDVYATYRAFLVMNKNAGTGECWGDTNYGGDCSGQDFTGITDVYASSGAFLALDKTTGTGFCWGSPTMGGVCNTVPLRGVTDVYTTLDAFLALNKPAGTGVCWGNTENGGDCGGLDLQGTVAVYSNARAFLAVKGDNTGVCWGDPEFGGDCDGLDFTGVTDVKASYGAFLAMDMAAGTGFCWGNARFGGECAHVDLLGTTEVQTTYGAFLAFKRGTAQGVCWGDPESGGDCSGVEFRGITDLYSTSEAFLALNKDWGMATCWGNADFGGHCANVDFAGTTLVLASGDAFLALKQVVVPPPMVGVCWPGRQCSAGMGGPFSLGLSDATDVYATKGAFLALDQSSGVGICWGQEEYGGACRDVDFWGTTDVYATYRAFLALNKDYGTGVCWGDHAYGGNCTGLDFTGITDVFANSVAFFALDKNTGTGFCWGNSKGTSRCDSMSFAGTTDVFSTSEAFLALNKDTGTGLCWGNREYGGSCDNVDFTGTFDVHGNAFAFLALRKMLSTVVGVCWGDPDFGGKCDGLDFRGITRISNTYGAFLALDQDGSESFCWGHRNYGGDCRDLALTGTTDVYTTYKAFLALNKNSGTGVCWGVPQFGGACDDVDLTGTTDVYSTSEAFLALNKESGSGVCWGNKDYGGRCSHVDLYGTSNVLASGNAFLALKYVVDPPPVLGICWPGPSCGHGVGPFSLGLTESVDVYATYGAFLALDKFFGTGVCWGAAKYGGDCADMDFAGITDVYANFRAFAALNKKAGTGFCWGDPLWGGNCTSMDFTGITEVYATQAAFLATSKGARTAFCWGSERSGGDCTSVALSGTTDVYSNLDAFLALNKDKGTGVCWGMSTKGGYCDGVDFSGTTDVYSTSAAFLALKKRSETGVCWGSQRFGGNCENKNFKGVTDVYTTFGAFLALNKRSGKGFCWGNKNDGGDCARVDLTGTTDVYSNYGAFLALKKGSGTGVCWGNAKSGGECSNMDLSHVTDVYSTSAAFLALKKKDGVVTGSCWGDHDYGGSCANVYFGGTNHVLANGEAFLALKVVPSTNPVIPPNLPTARSTITTTKTLDETTTTSRGGVVATTSTMTERTLATTTTTARRIATTTSTSFLALGSPSTISTSTIVTGLLILVCAVLAVVFMLMWRSNGQAAPQETRPRRSTAGIELQ